MAETTLEKHSVVRAAVLDVSRIERLVDLSLKPELINKTKEESSASKTLKKVCLQGKSIYFLRGSIPVVTRTPDLLSGGEASYQLSCAPSSEKV